MKASLSLQIKNDPVRNTVRVIAFYEFLLFYTTCKAKTPTGRGPHVRVNRIRKA